jgi:thiol-disulfide isomerase/thioredoxin
MPDFLFIDFEGKNRSLYEFKDKYVLIDFWGAWCIDCTYETPYHIEALKRFRNRGFDIVSLNTDEKIETAKSYIQKNKMDWTHATNDSIRRLVEETYRIQEYPSTVLIGPDAKVIVLNQKMLRGEHLIETLEKILPKK